MTRVKEGPLAFIRGVASDFSDDDAMSLAAAVAFYTALSFAPLVLLVWMVGGFLGDQTKNDLLKLFQSQLGPRAADATGAVLDAAQDQPAREWWRWAFSSVMLLVTASGVFAQLQASLNRVWDVQARPDEGLWGWLRKRLLSIGMVGAVLFLLLVSLVVSAAVGALAPAVAAAGWAAEAAGSVVVTTLVFAAMFKVLPDVRMSWRDVWVGSLITAVMFTAGKAVLTVYLENGGVGAGYGKAAGSLIALLVWVYYSCVILLLGAEVTQRFARLRGRGIEPSGHAERIGSRKESAAPVGAAQ